MRKIPNILFLFVVVIGVHSAFTQDMVYLANETFQQGKVIEKGPNAISFRSFSGAGNSPSIINKSEVLLIVYEDGTFDVFPDATAKSANAAEIISPISSRTFDWIVTENSIIHATIADAASKKIIYTLADAVNIQPSAIDKSQVLAIFYKNGRYSFFAPPTEVATALRNTLSTPSVKPVAPEPFQNTSSAATQTPTVLTNPSPANLSHDTIPFDPEEFKKRAQDNAKYLENLIGIIADKTTEQEIANRATDKAVKLFVEGALVQVSIVGTEQKPKYPIQNYLERLRVLPYDRVEIIWHKINYVSGIRKQGDKYYGTISYEQEFQGYIDGILTYSDITKKNMEVVVQPYEKLDAKGKVMQKWEVYFGDIGVMQTRNR